MGTPAYAEVFIEIKNSKKAIARIQKWVAKANGGKLDGDFDIRLEEIGADFIGAKICSGRVQNLEWQDEQFCDFCKTIPEVEEYSSDVWIRGEGQFYVKED